MFIGRTDAEAEALILWPPDAKSWLFRKDPDPGKGWRQDAQGAAEDEMVGWHHWFNAHESEQILGDSEGQGSLVCCSPWSCKELDMTEQLNNNNNYTTSRASENTELMIYDSRIRIDAKKWHYYFLGIRFFFFFWLYKLC